MKLIHIFLLTLIFSNVYSQEPEVEEIETKVDQVTVFFDKAQVTRKKSVDLSSGIFTLKFGKLSPFIDAKSIQVKAS
ncbi:MAG TPA: DUF4140 domain-containing protein, partial [Mariniphaga sp.]|nr:DUF4140 domain-containing protein [Mariniphaga sp.]